MKMLEQHFHRVRYSRRIQQMMKVEHTNRRMKCPPSHLQRQAFVSESMFCVR